MKARFYPLLAGCLVFAVGCGGSDGMKLVPIAGSISYKNAPVADAALVFYPDKGPPGAAKTDSSGAFVVETNGRRGGAIGKNKITVAIKQTKEIPPSDGRAMEFKNDTDAFKQYSNEKDTPLVIDVPAAGNRNLKLELVD